MCADFNAELVEMDGQDNHTCRRAARDPLKGVCTRRLRQRYRVRTHRVHLWSPSYFAASAGGAPWETLKAYNASSALRTRRGQHHP